jgi:hypothetical protein
MEIYYDSRALTFFKRFTDALHSSFTFETRSLIAVSFMLPAQILCFSTTVSCFPSFDDVTISLLTGSIEMLPSRCKRRSTPPKPKLRISSNQDLIVKRRPLLRRPLSTRLLGGVDDIIAREIARLCISVFSLVTRSVLSDIASPSVSYLYLELEKV